jgi:hypothetical protein
VKRPLVDRLSGSSAEAAGRRQARRVRDETLARVTFGLG